MNGVHDLGGMHNLGPIAPVAGEPLFHHEWERRAFAVTLAAGFLGEWNIDQSRFARERMPPAEYLASGYYEKWIHGLELLLIERGLVTEEELASGRSRPGMSVHGHPRRVPAAAVVPLLTKGSSARLPDTVPARFRPGARVRTRNDHPTGHTRLPRYARGRSGVVVIDHGVFIFADSHAMGLGKIPQRLYCVSFSAQELWGPRARPTDTVRLDLWDDHLDAEEVGQP